MTNICAAIGRQDVLKELPERQPTLARTALAEKTVLLVVDDLDEVEDPRVLPFLASLPDQTAILATARRQIEAPRQVRVGPLGPQDSAQLIDDLLDYKENGQALTNGQPTRRISLNSRETRELHRISGGIPLALVWATSLVGYGFESRSSYREI